MNAQFHRKRFVTSDGMVVYADDIWYPSTSLTNYVLMDYAQSTNQKDFFEKDENRMNVSKKIYNQFKQSGKFVFYDENFHKTITIIVDPC
jgi:hypothetical protein